MSTLTAESEGKVPSFNDKPVGPHPEGSFEVWCPAEQLGELTHGKKGRFGITVSWCLTITWA